MNSIEQFIASHPSGQQLMDEARLKRRATKKLLADYDKSLREQIAREIETELLCLCEKLHEIELQNFPESTSFPMCDRCIAAAIARGEK